MVVNSWCTYGPGEFLDVLCELLAEESLMGVVDEEEAQDLQVPHHQHSHTHQLTLHRVVHPLLLVQVTRQIQYQFITLHLFITI